MEKIESEFKKLMKDDHEKQYDDYGEEERP